VTSLLTNQSHCKVQIYGSNKSGGLAHKVDGNLEFTAMYFSRTWSANFIAVSDAGALMCVVFVILLKILLVGVPLDFLFVIN